MTRVKICGNTSRRDVAAALDAGADAVGFVTEVPVETHRNLDRDEAGVLIADVPPFVTSVLVIMPDDVDQAERLVAATGPDAVQVHAGLDADAVAALRRRTETPTIRRVPADADPEALAGEPVDGFIVDATDDAGGGGTGETTDWGAARRLVGALAAPVVLAGGLTPGNVAEAVETVRPFAVDVASGVEDDGGARDPRRVKRFVAAARGGRERGGGAAGDTGSGAGGDGDAAGGA